MMAINGHRVIDNFEASGVYLLHPAHEIRIPLDEFKPKKILKIENH